WEKLLASDIPLVVIETSRTRVDELRERGVRAVLGNAANEEIMQLAHLECAKWLILTIPNGYEAGEIVASARAKNPDIEIIARAHYDDEVTYITERGANQVVMGERKTQHPLLPGAIAEFNQYEFSRAMRHKDCQNPLRVYSHIAPYMGGPEKIMNTNGAGDGALAALLHDITANSYHRSNVPNSSKHKFTWLTYSSLAQVCKYANRVSYQVLNQHSPRLTRGLPEREDSLEESYWDR
ncbi:NAD-binding protein, partial [Escherichia sp. HC-CC4]